jgi:hypothetical protein
MQNFSLTSVGTVNDLIDLSRSLNLFVFRGQADARWDLATSLERAFLRAGRIIYTRETAEYWMLHEFRKKIHLYSTLSPANENTFEWLALLQHYGGATRLLDFSESIYVAAYFSILNSSDDSAIWAINRPLLRDNLCKFAELPYKHGEVLKDKVNDIHIDLFNKFVARIHRVDSDGNLPHLVPLESSLLFDRASRQRSLFLGAGYLGSAEEPFSFMDNLRASFPGIASELEAPKHISVNDLCKRPLNDPCYKQFAALKINIPKCLHSQLRLELALMGLTEESLFPGLDGLSRSLVQGHIFI